MELAFRREAGVPTSRSSWNQKDQKIAVVLISRRLGYLRLSPMAAAGGRSSNSCKISQNAQNVKVGGCVCTYGWVFDS
jgi:hypothetical protein